VGLGVRKPRYSAGEAAGRGLLRAKQESDNTYGGINQLASTEYSSTPTD
jgi:hypothetical protein